MAEEEGKTDTTTEEMEISTRSKGKNILHKFVFRSVGKALFLHLFLYLDSRVVWFGFILYIILLNISPCLLALSDCVSAGKLCCVISDILSCFKEAVSVAFLVCVNFDL